MKFKENMLLPVSIAISLIITLIGQYWIYTEESIGASEIIKVFTVPYFITLFLCYLILKKWLLKRINNNENKVHLLLKSIAVFIALCGLVVCTSIIWWLVINPLFG